MARGGIVGKLIALAAGKLVYRGNKAVFPRVKGMNATFEMAIGEDITP